MNYRTYIITIFFCLLGYQKTFATESIPKFSFKSDSILKSNIKTSKSFLFLKDKKPPRTKEHTLGLFSYLTLWTSYLGLILSLIISSSNFVAISELASTLAFFSIWLGIFGFLLAILCLFLYIKKPKRGIIFPIMAVLMTLLPIAGFIYIIINIGKNGG
jgi:hypothetical protein